MRSGLLNGKQTAMLGKALSDITLDPRITPARGDLAAETLRGRVSAPRYAAAAPMQVSAGVAALRRAPQGDAEMVSQLLHGEVFDVYDEHEGWAWGQAALDGYVGYAAMEALSAPVLPATHKVSALRTYAFSRPDIRSAPFFLLSLNARLAVEEQVGDFVRAARCGWIPAVHVAPLEEVAADWVAVAERFLGAPYLWGGRESLGLDCSGLMQSALAAAGVAAPRDADMQEQAFVTLVDREAPRERGDVVFWRGHVGVMLDGQRLLHANGTCMETAIEPLSLVAARMLTKEGPITSVRRPV